MAKRPNIIPRAPLARILMNAGAKRVSASGVESFAEILEVRVDKIAAQAARIAKHSGRKTVNDEDVRLAAKQG